jgi:Rod binding domain-containing protein
MPSVTNLTRFSPDAGALSLAGKARAGPLDASQESFAGIMSRLSPRADGTHESPLERARKAAEDLVSITFVQPLLKQLRSMNMAAAPFAPTAAERQFQSMMDATLAQRMVHSSRWGVVDRVAQDLLKKARETVPSDPRTDARARAISE